MVVSECRREESSLKRRKLWEEPMTMEKGSSSAYIGPMGLIKRHEFVRVIIQCLSSLGFHKSAFCLESESGISSKSKDFEVLEPEILNGNWEDCIKCLSGIKGLTDETRSSALFLILQQCLLEFLSHGDVSTALAFLQKQVSALKMETDKIRILAFNMLFKGSGEINSSISELRKKLLGELEKLLPPPVVLPERRLEHLVGTAVVSQIDSCVYHNSPGPVSLYEDHCCGRDQIPTDTVQVCFSCPFPVAFNCGAL